MIPEHDFLGKAVQEKSRPRRSKGTPGFFLRPNLMP
jgi:hypothetical protein